ncbi:protogenin-like isoform X2 [Ischnura elegans]|uniref:protogenin-like isoform X2 n=1 Tax=Ischnura elegans TaxID=197161 RepID=UPI001ED8B5FE|nr:protogenin-like isoform X2 [Ischnura elegans]
MAPRVFLLCTVFTIGILTGRIAGASVIDLTLGFVREPDDVVVAKGQPAVLNCSVFSDPEFGPARLSWTLDGEPLVNEKSVVISTASSPPSLSHRRDLLANGSLYFKKVVHKRGGGISDQGTYRCIARNSVGVLVSRPAQLRIAVLSNNFSEVPADQFVEEKDVARFRCQIDSIPTALISWERNRAPLPQNSRYFVLSSGVLQIVGVQPSDAGSYRCIANNAVAKKQRRSPEAALRVSQFSGTYRPPQFLMWPPATNETASAAATSHATSLLLSSHPSLSEMQFVEVVVQQGQDLVLECAASGWPVPKLTWSRSPSLIPGIEDDTEIPREVINTTSSGTNNLPLKTVQVQDGGAYFCMATNKNLENQVTSITQAIWVGVLAPPIFIRAPNSQVFPSAKTVRFECEVGLPPGPGSSLFPPLPPVVWLKDGALLDINGRVKQRPPVLVLSNTVTDDSGLYQCVARVGKRHGHEIEVWSAARLLVNVSRFQPDPPQGLSCRPHSPTEVQLDWSAPPPLRSEEGLGAGSDIKAYTVHYLPTVGGVEQETVALNKTLIVQKLIPYTNYTFYVRAYSEKSASDMSVKVICRTDESVPQAAPSISLEASSHTTLRVTWKPLEPNAARGEITHHKVQWRRLDHATIHVEEVKGLVHEYTITGLIPGQAYEVRVLAATSKGWPDVPDISLPWKEYEMPSFGQQNVPSPPNVHLTAVNSSSIKVTWSMPKDEKVTPDGFRLYYLKLNSKQMGPIDLPGNTFQYLLTGLEPQVQYKVMLQGYNQEGNGSMGVKAIYTLPLESSSPIGSEDNGVTGPAPPAPPTSPDDPGGTGVMGNVEPPYGLEAQPTSPRSINLTWIPPSPAATHYTVSYNPVQSSLSVNSSTVKYISSTSNSVEISGLKPFTLYEFKVRSHDEKNHQGHYGHKVECKTLEDVPTAPQDVQLKAKNTTCIRLSWKEPLLVNGVVKNYVIRYTNDPTLPLDKWTVLKVLGNHYTTEISGLSSNIQYHLSLRAETGAGEGEAVQLTARTFPTSSGSGITEPPANSGPGNEQKDQHLGMMAGMFTILFCMILCVTSIMCHRQCRKTASPDLPPGSSGRCGGSHGVGQHGLHVPGIGGHANGNGLCKDRARGFVVGGSGGLVPSLSGGGARAAAEAHEMEFITPMLVSVPPETDAHLDTKYDLGTVSRIPLPKHLSQYTAIGVHTDGEGDTVLWPGCNSTEKASNLLLGESEDEDEEDEGVVEGMRGGGGGNSVSGGGSVGDPDTTQLTSLSYDANEDESGCVGGGRVGDSGAPSSSCGVDQEDSSRSVTTSGQSEPSNVRAAPMSWHQPEFTLGHEDKQQLFFSDNSSGDHGSGLREDEPIVEGSSSRSGVRRHIPHSLGLSLGQPPSTSTPLLVPKG